MNHDIVATVGSYTKDGEPKYITRKVGSMFETKHGLRIKLDAFFNPAGCEKTEDGQIWLAVFESKPKEKETTAQMAKRVMYEQPESDTIPF